MRKAIQVTSMVFIVCVLGAMVLLLSYAHPAIVDRLFQVTPTPAMCAHSTIVNTGNGYAVVNSDVCP